MLFPFVLPAATMAIVNLSLYCAQQVGVMLGVGAETIALVAYLLAMRDGIRDEEEAGFSRAIRRVRGAGLLLIILSGAAVTALQYSTAPGAVISSPAFLFKWALIGFILLLSLAVRGVSWPAALLEGVAGGTWYALFAVHILAPVTTWQTLGTFYGVGLLGFMLVWVVFVFALRGKPQKSPAAIPLAPRTTLLSFVPPPTASIPAAVPLAPTAPASTVAPVVESTQAATLGSFSELTAASSAGLPGIRVMPKSAAELKPQ